MAKTTLVQNETTPTQLNITALSSAGYATSGTQDGDPILAEDINDYKGFASAVLNDNGITASGTPDTQANSQVYQGLNKKFDQIRYKTLSEAITENAPAGTRYVITDQDNTRYDVVLGADTGGFYIGTLSSGRKLRKVIDRLDYVTLEEMFIAGDADYTNAITRALQASDTIKLKHGKSYTYSQTINLQDGQSIISDCNLNYATLVKNIDNAIGITMQSYTQIIGVTHDCNNKAGAGIVVQSGFGQKISKFKTLNSNGHGLIFDPNVGGGAKVSEIEGYTNDIDQWDAIRFTKDTQAVPRFFNSIWLAGGSFGAKGGGNGCSMSNFYISRFNTGFDEVDGLTKTSLMHLSNGRIAGQGATRTYTADECDIVGVAIAEIVNLENCQGFKLVGGSVDGISENPVNCQYNEIYTKTIEYTSDWVQSGGTQPDIGNGAKKSFYQRKGSTCTVSIQVLAGSTTTFGNNSTGWTFTLPFNSSILQDQRGIPVKIVSGATQYDVNGVIAANDNKLQLLYNGQSVRSDYPQAWGVGDTIELHFEYFVR